LETVAITILGTSFNCRCYPETIIDLVLIDRLRYIGMAASNI
jgi:hypothetical protein